MQQNNIVLENWSVATFNRLTGNVYGHPRMVNGEKRFPDGRRVWTSTIVRVDLKNNLVYTRSGSCYFLGTIDKDLDEEMVKRDLFNLASELNANNYEASN